MITTVDVIFLMSAIPGGYKYIGLPDTPRIASAVATAVNEEKETILGSPLKDAALMTKFIKEESGFRPCAIGDHGLAVGILQLHDIGMSACDPLVSTREWTRRLHVATKRCKSSMLGYGLTALASGRCGGALRLVQRRIDAAKRLAKFVQDFMMVVDDNDAVSLNEAMPN